MTPRDLARQAGVSTDTLRHYERKGLIDAPPRIAPATGAIRPKPWRGSASSGGPWRLDSP
jgi:hypothetical protein